MPTNRKYSQRHFFDLAPVVLITAGIAAWTYGTRLAEDTSLMMMAESPGEESVLDQYNASAKTPVIALSQLTSEELLVADQAWQTDFAAARHAAELRYYLMQLVMVTASICWLVGLVSVMFRRSGSNHQPRPGQEVGQDHDTQGHSKIAAGGPVPAVPTTGSLT